MNKTDFSPQLDQLLQLGFTTVQFDLVQELEKLNQDLKNLSQAKLGKSVENLSEIHKILTPDQINSFRLELIKQINQTDFKNRFIEKISPFFSSILGEDLAYQKNLNLILMTPNDATSILPLHADTWTGHSSFELAVLFPLTSIIPEQNMFLMPLEAWRAHKETLQNMQSLQEATEALQKSFHYLNLKAGEALVFWHHIPHGNKVNQSQHSHWSINFRVKNVFTPYKEKGLGDYFQPYKLSRFNEFVFRESTHEPKNSRLHNK